MAIAPCLTTYYPKDKDLFTKDGDAWNALNAGYNISINQEGMIVETWDAKTGKLYDNLGEEIGDKTDPIEKLHMASEQKGGLRTWSWTDTENPDCPCQFKEFFDAGYLVTTDAKGNAVDIWHPEEHDVINENYQILGERLYPYLSELAGFKTATADTAEALNIPQAIIDRLTEVISEYPGMEVTINPSEVFVEFWYPEAGIIFDWDLLEQGNRATSFNAKRFKHISGGLITYKRRDRFNVVLTDEIVGLLESNYWVTLTGALEIVDIWDPKNHVVIDTKRNAISLRAFPFPSENNLGAVELEIKVLYEEQSILKTTLGVAKGTGIPVGYFEFFTMDGELEGNPPIGQEQLQAQIFEQIGDYVAYANEAGTILDIQEVTQGIVYSIEGHDINTLEKVGKRVANYIDTLDYSVFRLSIDRTKSAISAIKSALVKKNNWLSGMRRLKKRLNIKKTINRVNK